MGSSYDFFSPVCVNIVLWAEGKVVEKKGMSNCLSHLTLAHFEGVGAWDPQMYSFMSMPSVALVPQQVGNSPW